MLLLQIQVIIAGHSGKGLHRHAMDRTGVFVMTMEGSVQLIWLAAAGAAGTGAGAGDPALVEFPATPEQSAHRSVAHEADAEAVSLGECCPAGCLQAAITVQTGTEAVRQRAGRTARAGAAIAGVGAARAGATVAGAGLRQLAPCHC